MFNFLSQYKPIANEWNSLNKKFQSSDEKTKTKVFKLVLVGLAVFIGITTFVVVSHIVNQSEVNQSPAQTIDIHKKYEQIPDPSKLTDEEIHEVLDIPEEEQGRGIDIPNPLDALNPFSSFQKSVVDALSEIVTQGLELFDDYVGFTPNIANSDGDIKDARGNQITLGVNKFYNASRTVAFLILPLIIVLNGAQIILEGREKGIQMIMQLGKKLLLFGVGLIVIRFLFAQAIDLNNALSRYVLQTLVGQAGSDTLSGALLASFGMNIVDGKLGFNLNDALNLFGEIILWIGLFFLILTILFQFVSRFFHLLLYMVMYPIVLVLSLLPGGSGTFQPYLDKILRNLFMQPIFLAGLGLSLEVIHSINEPIPKIVLGLGSLAFLNTIPNLVGGAMGGRNIFSFMAGGFMTAAVVGKARGLMSGKGGKPSMAGQAATSAVSSKIPFVGTAAKAVGGLGFGKASSAVLMKGQTNPGAFKQSFMSGNAGSAFKSLGMKPLSKDQLSIGGSKELNKVDADFGEISNVSLKDSEQLSSSFNNSNFDFFMNDYPLVESEGQPTIHQMTDLSGFKPVNNDTSELMNNVIKTEKMTKDLGVTFNASNKTQWNHLAEWYAKNEAKSTGQPFENFQTFVQNPKNRMDVVRRASSEGYFESQGINTVKLKEHRSGQKPIAKYYTVKNQKGPNSY